MMDKKIKTISTSTCKRCGHIWLPRVEKPVTCPKCKSSLWNQDRKKKDEAESLKKDSENNKSSPADQMSDYRPWLAR